MDAQVINLKMEPDRPVSKAVEKVMLTIPEAARLCALSRYSINRLIDNGFLEVKYIGRSKRIPYEALKKWANNGKPQA